jgi:PIN domain nuclease of toxin-antitoxin system
MWVWMLEGDTSRMSPAMPAIIQRAAADGNLAVSDISFWEVAVKAAKGKLVLSVDATIWLARAERAPGIGYIALDRTILVQSTRLVGSMHGDPADRKLIATAQLRSMPLVTVDEAIINYAGSQPGIPVCDARA